MAEFIENIEHMLDATMKKKENDNDDKDEIEKQLREQAKRLQELKKNKSVEQFENEYLNHF